MLIPSDDAPGTFAPSEIVALHGNRFTAPGGRFTIDYPLLTGSGSAPRDALAEVLLRAAVLGLERDGHLRLEHTRKKALFGLLKPHTVMAEASGDNAEPVGRVEQGLLAALRGAEKPIEVDDMIYRWLATDRMSPHADVLEEATFGLRDRGLVDETIEEGKALFIIKTRTVRHALADTARAAVAGIDTAPVQHLLDSADARGELGARLAVEVQQGLNRRTQPDRDVDYND